jgi:hypothetical protein
MDNVQKDSYYRLCLLHCSKSWTRWIESSPHPNTKFIKTPMNIIFTSTSWSPNWSLPVIFARQNVVYLFHYPHACYMSRPSWFHHPNIYWRIKMMKLPLLLNHYYCYVCTHCINLVFVTCKSTFLWSWLIMRCIREH